MKKWLLVIILFSGVIAVSISQYRSILTAYAKFFTVNNATPGADVIVVLSGGKDTRIPHALKLFEEGYAPEILLTDEKKRNFRFAHLFPTNEMIAQAMIEELEMSVPVSTIRSQKGGATSTFDEAYDLLKLSEKKRYGHLILVTDAFHTRRAYHAFQTVFEDTEIKIEMSAASNEIFNVNNWWTSDQGISAYVLESIKYPVYLLSSRNVTFIRND
ncbi:MAG: YdcF family protein [SAR324 cluster bacterium]|nr:YdcF family protein [SAR324 cluster bacterium]